MILVSYILEPQAPPVGDFGSLQLHALNEKERWSAILIFVAIYERVHNRDKGSVCSE